MVSAASAANAVVPVGGENGAKPQALIALKGIRKHFGGSNGAPAVEVLHGIDLDIFAGEFVAIVGQSGSGKSTLMNILGCLDQPSAGQYLFNGQDVAHLEADTLAWLRREAFGFVFQGYHLIATESASENVQIPAMYAGEPAQARQARAQALLAQLGLQGKQHNLPSQLSGGQQQRVSIARALMNGGRIVLADEPTGALDSQSGKEVMALLHRLADAGHTIILITHDKGVAEQARRVIEIHDGEIVSDSGNRGQGSKNAQVLAQAIEVASAASAAEMPDAQSAEAAAAQAAAAASASCKQAASELDLARANEAPGLGWAAGFSEAAKGAWRGMRLNRSRTLLTLLGIIIGVASVIVMLAVGEGARQSVMNQLGALGPTTMYISGRYPPDGGPRGEITVGDFDAIAELPEVAGVQPILRDPGLLRYGRESLQTEVLATSESMPRLQQWPVVVGRFFTDRENRQIAPVVVLGSVASERLFVNGEDPLGKQILINNAPYEVIGVLAERGSTSSSENPDEQVFVPHQTGMVRIFPHVRDESYGVIGAASAAQVLQAQAKIEQLLLQRHNGREDYRVFNAAAQLQAEAETRKTLTLLLSLTAAVSLLVGGIGVMNVMLMTVKERTKEIGIRMATGARQKDIQRQFMTEAVLVTITGGCLGAALGFGMSLGLLAFDIPVVLSVRAIVGAFACAVLTGLVFGFMPARSAARLNPVVALTGI